MKATYKLAIFDMDGTILNTLTDICNSINHCLETNNLPLRTMDEVRSFVGNGLHKLVERAVPENSPSEIVEKVFSELLVYYGEHSKDSTGPYDGISDAIVAIRNKGILTAVVSNKADFAVQKLAAGFFPGLFDMAIGEKQGFAVKPAPDMVNEILNKLNISANESVYIGDSEVDLQTAANSCMDCIAVSWGFRSVEFLKAQKAECIINSPSELPEYFS